MGEALSCGSSFLLVKGRKSRSQRYLVFQIFLSRLLNGLFRCQIFVLKQSWQPWEVEGEEKLYEVASGIECDNVGKIETWEDVSVSGQPDTMDGLIRQSLNDSTGPGKRSTQRGKESIDQCICTFITDFCDIQELRARGSRSPISRVRTRVVLSTYGWLIKYFSTLPELLRVLRDAINGINDF